MRPERADDPRKSCHNLMFYFFVMHLQSDSLVTITPSVANKSSQVACLDWSPLALRGSRAAFRRDDHNNYNEFPVLTCVGSPDEHPLLVSHDDNCRHLILQGKDLELSTELPDYDLGPRIGIPAWGSNNKDYEKACMLLNTSVKISKLLMESLHLYLHLAFTFMSCTLVVWFTFPI